MRPSLDSFKQASSNALSKAQLMVGLNNDDGNGGDATNSDVEMANKSNNDGDNPSNRSSSLRGLFGRGGEEESSLDNSERSSTFVEEAADLLCPELTFQQRLIGFASCFTTACKYKRTIY